MITVREDAFKRPLEHGNQRIHVSSKEFEFFFRTLEMDGGDWIMSSNGYFKSTMESETYYIFQRPKGGTHLRTTMQSVRILGGFHLL